jgi:hypothetical protein
MTILEKFMPIIPRHQRLLSDLVAVRNRDVFGGIGWAALLDEDEQFTIDQLFKPLRDRGLIEDLTGTELGERGAMFVRITPVGQKCLGLGWMLKEPRPMHDGEVKKYLAVAKTEEVTA